MGRNNHPQQSIKSRRGQRGHQLYNDCNQQAYVVYIQVAAIEGGVFLMLTASLIANGKCVPKKSPKLILKTALKYLTNNTLFSSSSGKVRTGASILITLLAMVRSLSLCCIVLHCIALYCIAFPLVWSSLSSCF